jgi:hypothetical protein
MSGVGSCATGGRTESPTAMMRIAKIADVEVDGGGKPDGLELGADVEVDGGGKPDVLEAGGGGAAAISGTEGDESLRKRGPGGSLRGRGGDAIGRSAVAFA